MSRNLERNKDDRCYKGAMSVKINLSKSGTNTDERCYNDARLVKVNLSKFGTYTENSYH